MRTSTAEQNGGTACVASDGSDTQSCSVECPGKTKYIGKSDYSFSQCQSFQYTVNGPPGMCGLIVQLPVLLVMVLVIKPEQEQVQLRVMVELHVLRLMEVTLNLAVQSVPVRQIT